MNKLYYGDCLTIMQEMKLNSVDLIYLDPPFNSKKDYNNIYKDETGRPLPEQVKAFCDQWTLDEQRERAIRGMPVLMREAGVDDDVTEFWKIWMNALRKTHPRLLAYLSYMVERIIWMRGLLKPTGSIYLHCDPTASHYIKVMMDGIFGHKNFLNEIIWHYQTGGVSKHWYGRKHDVILFYKNSKNHKFFPDKIKVARTPEVIRRIKTGSPTATRATSLTKLPMDVWTDVQALNAMAKERLGYSTQKPVELLERIIKASSSEGDVVFDPFCGCGTTIEAAHRFNRKWIGIDIAYHAIQRVTRYRLEDQLSLIKDKDFKIEGFPITLEGAKDLWKRDKYHFQEWAVSEAEGFVTTKRTADGGIDGRLYFGSSKDKELKSMVIEVKGGKNVNIADLRALHSVMERDNAEMAGLIILEPLHTRQEKNFHKLMAEAGDYEYENRLYSRMQILTVQELLDGKLFDTPFSMGKRKTAQQDLRFR